jgi:hypothetical protein
MKKVLSFLFIGIILCCSYESNAIIINNEKNSYDNQLNIKLLNKETLDQSSPFGSCGTWNTYLAQSFRPKLSILTKVELGLFKQEGAKGEVTVSIRERLKGQDLTKKSISVNNIPLVTDPDWIEFDFDDIQVTPNKKYYIVFTMNEGERPENVVPWIHTSSNPYKHGRPWSYVTLNCWLPSFIIISKFPDMSFRTYGYDSDNIEKIEKNKAYFCNVDIYGKGSILIVGPPLAIKGYGLYFLMKADLESDAYTEIITKKNPEDPIVLEGNHTITMFGFFGLFENGGCDGGVCHPNKIKGSPIFCMWENK